ncbi:MAG: hypothetical protein WCO94_11510 [Verrucomicrobiota bacterium]
MAWNWENSLTGLCLLALITGASEAAENALAGKSTSASGEFVIYSKDGTRRTALAQRADDARAQWQQRIGADVTRSQPIIIQDLIGTPKPRGNSNIVTGIFEGDGGMMKVQTDIYDASALRGQALETEIYRALGLDLIYRNHPPKIGKAFRSPPAWLLEALAEEKRIKENGAPEGVYSALLKSEHPPRIEDFLKAKPELMEATSLTLYRTQAVALLKALQQLPEGSKGLANFLGSIAENDADMKSLLAAFPSLENSPSRLGKIWTLSIARNSTSKGTDPYSIGETVRALHELLEVSALVDPKRPALGKVTGPAALSLLAKCEGGAYMMRQKSAEFMTLGFRAHPLLKPVIAEYCKITTVLASKPKKNVDKQIEETGKILDLLLQRTGKVGDYLNWFEATQLDTLSENFLEVTSPLEVPKRTDPISAHLDAIEDRGW